MRDGGHAWLSENQHILPVYVVLEHTCHMHIEIKAERGKEFV